MFNTVANKSESRITAEWSMQSTLAYTAIVMVNHFIPNVIPTIYHPKKTDLGPEAVELWNIAERCYNNMIGHATIKEKLFPILPNLVTTTDEVTIFATTGIVNDKESFYIVARPDEIKNESSNSGSRNDYKKNPTGNAHCRGVRIVINSTFTAGGLAAPIFIAVYGLTLEEMPRDDIITISVPGLISGSHQNIYSVGNGYITFVRGNDVTINQAENQTDLNINDNSNSSTQIHAGYSKESRVASIYRKSVYYPFIAKIRKDKYLFSGAIDEIPEHLRAVSWMDGCNSQLKVITSMTICK